MLASQLAQRLLKGQLKTPIKDPAKDLPFLKKFLDVMAEALADNEDILGGEKSGTSDVLSIARSLLDSKAAPSEVNSGSDTLLKSDHWLAQAFKLEKGKKVIQWARENAFSREGQDQILTRIRAALFGMEEEAVTADCDLDPETHTLDAAYGQMFLG